MKKLLLIAPIVILFASCAKTKFIDTTGKIKYTQNGDYREIVVYLSPDEIPAGYERVGLITSKKKKENKAYKNAKKKAANHGATAILFSDGRELKGSEKMANTFLWPGIFKAKWKFIAFREKQ